MCGSWKTQSVAFARPGSISIFSIGVVFDFDSVLLVHCFESVDGLQVIIRGSDRNWLPGLKPVA
jgi:hypothetical protein